MNVVADEVIADVPAAVAEDTATAAAEAPSSGERCVPEPMKDVAGPVLEDGARTVGEWSEDVVRRLLAYCSATRLVWFDRTCR